MKVSEIIGNYCQLYGVAMPEIDYSKTQYFVTFSPASVGILYLHKPSKLLGQVVSSAMKRGTVLYVHNGWVAPLTWENWKQTWVRVFAPKARKDKAPEPNCVHPYKSKIFEEMQYKRPCKKPQKHGFERTFTANQSMNLLGHPMSKIGVGSI